MAARHLQDERRPEAALMPVLLSYQANIQFNSGHM